MKKFLIISNYLPSVYHLRGKLLESISRLGYEIHILAPYPNMHNDIYQQLQGLNYNIHSIPLSRTGTNPIDDIKTLFAIYNKIVQIQPEAMLAYTIKPVIYGILAAWLARTPKRFALLAGLGYTFQDVENIKSGKAILKRIAHKLYKESLSKSTKVFFQNTDDRDLMKEMGILGSSTPSTIVNGSGVDTEQYSVTNFPLNSSGNIKPSFLLIARLLKDKGINEYISAAKIIKQQYPLVEFNLVGWIDENPEAISQVYLDECINSGIINYWGKLEDVRPAISSSSVYVLPSYREGTPRSVLEAMSMGRPIITSDAPGCRETVNDGENGYLIPIKDPEKLADAMLKFVKNSELCITMGKASRKIAESKYDVHKVNSHMISEMQL